MRALPFSCCPLGCCAERGASYYAWAKPKFHVRLVPICQWTVRRASFQAVLLNPLTETDLDGWDQEQNLIFEFGNAN